MLMAESRHTKAENVRRCFKPSAAVIGVAPSVWPRLAPDADRPPSAFEPLPLPVVDVPVPQRRWNRGVTGQDAHGVLQGATTSGGQRQPWSTPRLAQSTETGVAGAGSTGAGPVVMPCCDIR
ncbi:hypothetical protein GCM10014715_83230 [Streptomyces spiralis]|uniref:Uncharacterized protein n=1 Tax=Streptomyces spiralis TaxID=66376 RepID=A0A919ALY2_9ACTN|nr:hypothetical protein GCM10014715_83230 [Streptomyces spiralis]